MAGVSAGPDAFFRVGPAEPGRAQCFAVKRGDIEGRVDVNYWQLTPLVDQRFESSRFAVVPLGSLLSLVQYGCSKLAKAGPPGVPILRMNNLQDDGWDLSDLKYIALDERELDTYRLVPNDILFNRTNSKELVGKCEVFRESGDWAFASYLIRVRTNENCLLPQFASDFLESGIGRLQIDRLSRQIIGMTNINAEEIRELRIPLPSIAEQERLIAAMDAARIERNAKLADADALLAGLDDFLLDALGIEPPDEDSRRVFAIRRSQMSMATLGPSLYMPELQNYMNRLRSNPAVTKPLSAYVDVNPRTNFSKVDEDTIVGFIPMKAVADGATGEYTVAERPMSEVRKGYTPFINGDVLWAKITPCMQNGKSCVVGNLPNGSGFGSTEFHILRVRSSGISNVFVKEFVSQAMLRRVATHSFTGSAGQQRVPASFLDDLPFPELPEDRQNEIVLAMNATREQAVRLRSEAETGWQETKRWFEEQLLGPAAP